MATATIQRKYVLVRIGTGDYMFAGNDGKSIWRVRRYTEGPSSGLDWERDRDVWGAWRWIGRMKPDAISLEDVEDESNWDFHDGMCDTRAEAIQDALKAEAA